MKNQTQKTMAILTIVSTILMGSLLAQPGQRPQQPPIPDSGQIAQMVDEMTQKLSLTDDQTDTILGLYTNHFAELKSKMETDKAQHEKQRSEMDNFRKEFEEEVKAALTDEQKEQFETFLKENTPQHGPGPRGPRK